MIPFFAWSLIAYATHGEYTLERLLKIILRPDAFFWFLWVLFFICVFFVGAQVLARKLRVYEDWVILGLGLMLVGIMITSDIRMFAFQQVAYYYLFYAVGYLFHKHPELTIKNTAIQVVLTVIWFILAWFWQQHGLPGWIPKTHYLPISMEQYLYRGLTTLTAVIVILSIAPRLLDGSGHLNQVMRYLGSISLGLYVVHLSFGGIKIIISAIMILHPTITFTPLIVLSSLVSLATSTLIVTYLMKNRWIAQILFGKLK